MVDTTLTFKGKNILIVDDDESSLKIMSRILEKKGFDVDVAETGNAALLKLAETFYFVALLDIKLPDIDGIELLAKLKDMHPDMIVFMVTGNASLDNAVDSINRGATGYVIKPIEMDSLINSISHALEKQHLIMENKRLYKEAKQELKERRKVENQLRNSRELLRKVIDTDKNCIFVKDAKGRYLLANEAVANIFGRSPKELIGKTDFDFVDKSQLEERDVSQFMENNLQVIKTRIPLETLEEIHVSGGTRWFQSRMVPMSLGKSYDSVLGVCADVTEQIEADRHIKESEERLRTIINSLQIGIVIIDPVTHIIVDANPMAEKMIGAPKENIVGEECHTYICPAERGSCPVTDLGQKIENSEKTLRKANGEEIPVLKTVVTVKMSGKEYLLDSFVDVTDWKLSENALKESEQRLELALSGANLGLWDWNIKTDVNIFDERWANMIGYAFDELEPNSRSWERLMHPDDKEAAFYELERHFNNEIPFYVANFRLKTKAGGWKWIQGRGKVVEWTPHGEPLRMVGTHMDLTSIKDTEVALQWELQVNSALAELSHALINPKTSIETISNILLESAQKITHSDHGYVGTIHPESGNLVVHTFTQMVENDCHIPDADNKIEYSPNPDGTYKALYGHSLNTQKPFYVNDPQTHDSSSGVPDGHIPLKNFLSVPALIGKKLVGQISLANSLYDYGEKELNAITRMGELFAVAIHRVREEEKLEEYSNNLKLMVDKRTEELNRSLVDTKEAKERIDAILKSVADGMLVTDRYHNVILMNRAAEELLGIRFSDVINRPIGYALSDSEMQSKLLHSLEMLEAFEKIDFTIPGKHGGENAILEARTSIIYDNDGEESGVVTIIHDVTHEREVDRMKTEFISTAAHELRTPLTSIVGFSKILVTRDDITAEENIRFLNYIYNQGMKLSRIVNDLLDISRIESGKGFELEVEPSNIGELIEQVLPYYEELSSIHTFELVKPDEPVMVQVDSEKIEQVLKNLLSNAVKYSPDGGSIRIALTMEDSRCRITLEDEGIGMTSDQVERIFDKFYRADATDSAPEGTGLGMVIVKNIIEAHGGTIDVESESGVGTVVNISLPENVVA